MPSEVAVLTEALERTGVHHGPGLFGLVTQNGQTVFQGSVGAADLVRPRPIEASDRFRIASVTKTYVAAVVMQLVAEGVLSFTDSVQQWLPDLVPHSCDITVEVLLRMRSGLPDWIGPVFGDPPDLRALDRYWAPGEPVRMALTAAHDRLAVDTGYRYCNTDYALLGMMIEQATGQSMEAQLWQPDQPRTGSGALRLRRRDRRVRAHWRNAGLQHRCPTDHDRPLRRPLPERARRSRSAVQPRAGHHGRRRRFEPAGVTMSTTHGRTPTARRSPTRSSTICHDRRARGTVVSWMPRSCWVSKVGW